GSTRLLNSSTTLPSPRTRTTAISTTRAPAPGSRPVVSMSSTAYSRSAARTPALRRVSAPVRSVPIVVSTLLAVVHPGQRPGTASDPTAHLGQAFPVGSRMITTPEKAAFPEENAPVQRSGPVHPRVHEP